VHRKDEIEQLCQNHNGHPQFPNWRAEKLTGGTQEVSLEVVLDQ
jgi:hypothetical protein